MTKDEFWALIDSARDEKGDTFETAENLREALEKRPLADVIAFMATLGQLLEESYTLGLRGATTLAHGGCSDDQFEAFRGWLLAQGRAVFEKVLADPDSLVEVLPEADKAESEQMLYVGALAHEAATGEFPEGPTFTAAPSQADFDLEDRAELERRYPRLWAKFSSAPRRVEESIDD
jgi:hypothetical protein